MAEESVSARARLLAALRLGDLSAVLEIGRNHPRIVHIQFTQEELLAIEDFALHLAERPELRDRLAVAMMDEATKPLTVLILRAISAKLSPVSELLIKEELYTLAALDEKWGDLDDRLEHGYFQELWDDRPDQDELDIIELMMAGEEALEYQAETLWQSGQARIARLSIQRSWRVIWRVLSR